MTVFKLLLKTNKITHGADKLILIDKKLTLEILFTLLLKYEINNRKKCEKFKVKEYNGPEIITKN